MIRKIHIIIPFFFLFLTHSQAQVSPSIFHITVDDHFLVDSLFKRSEDSRKIEFSLFANEDEPMADWNELFIHLNNDFESIANFSKYLYPNTATNPKIRKDAILDATMYFLTPVSFNLTETLSNSKNQELIYEGVDIKLIESNAKSTLYRVRRHHINGLCTSNTIEPVALKKPLEKLSIAYKAWLDGETFKNNTKDIQDLKRAVDRQKKDLEDLSVSNSKNTTSRLTMESRPTFIIDLNYNYITNLCARPSANEGSVTKLSHAGQSIGIDMYSITKGVTRKKPSLGFHVGLKISDASMDLQSASFSNSIDSKDVFGNYYVRKNYYTDWQERLTARFLEVPFGFCYYPINKERQLLRLEFAPTLVFVSSVEDRLVSGQLTTRAQYTGIKDELANVEGLGLKDEQALSDVTLFSYSNQKHITASIGVAYYQAVYKNLFVHGSAGFTCYPNFIKSLESDKSTMSTQDLLSSFALQAHPVYSPGRLHLGLGIAFKIN